ncbi:uncharacterized protein [Panulirus ornatus]|uniref:uncharacterized protein n=1 Tax=Panulirus ornatus TaxID=150431 RepID=UPI003A840B4C
MEEAVRCSVCSEVYQTGPRDPLVLPCGHAFCRSCLTNVYITGNFICPSCRRDLNHLDVQDLPRCFPLLSLSASYSEFQYERCSLHDDDQTYWCRQCERSMCSLCLYTDHPVGHQVLHTKTFLQEKKRSLERQIIYLSNAVNATRKEVHENCRMFLQEVKRFCKFDEFVAEISRKVQKAHNIAGLVTCEEKIQLILEKQLDNLSVDRDASGWSGERSDVAEQQTTPDQTPTTVDNRRAALDCQEGRLLLHSFHHPGDSCLHLQLPSEVFLELSVAGRCLGRVYIKLWGHLRRAHQFLALCLGTLGPSYVGASFSHVAYMKKARESLCCKEYRSSDGKSCTRELMNDLEWGGEFARTPQEGLVIPLSKNIDEHGFGICTRGQLEGRFHCPFGEVTSGLKFVRAAIRHDPVTEVTITDCGLVLPDLTP